MVNVIRDVLNSKDLEAHVVGSDISVERPSIPIYFRTKFGLSNKKCCKLSNIPNKISWDARKSSKVPSILVTLDKSETTECIR